MFFAAAQPWGFILFARNVESPEQLGRLTRDLRDAVGRDAPVLIDQEGGRVQRLRPPHWREWPPALDEVAAAGPGAAARAMYLRSRLIAAELRAVGIDVNCAPLADVARTTTHPILRNRLYGDDPEAVAEIALAVALGLIDGGVVPVVKHLPGYGLGEVDSHESLPRVDAGADELRRTDFAAFRPLADLPLGMTAHIVYEAFDPETPATLSAEMIRLIRDDIGFGGLLMTDDLSMGALPGPIGERAARARAAGCDLILHCNGRRAEMEDVLAEAGTMDEGALARGAAALALRSGALPLDMDEMEAELDRLRNGDVDG
ncbi:glycoside hydrolase family 3 N-terminal domain-containing protein [Roseibacterium sp. SDUM158017]|uniref:glycoside hydrolase family 3 N-terminal domain-containing protein n=1 Tax=Roseicyclus salinarum TaxID=3036773 RepID=UPI0024155A39|nr:glycoside hydrolase family 3 N-terminal domain-containing protein [Roseibacterium sp. SDUM158017]MDG4649773.1 glycoside hydrolase family 3 N-terminal domain-containing protein [Roseibacterium sp. SDUM158017]